MHWFRPTPRAICNEPIALMDAPYHGHDDDGQPGQPSEMLQQQQATPMPQDTPQPQATFDTAPSFASSAVSGGSEVVMMHGPVNNPGPALRQEPTRPIWNV